MHSKSTQILKLVNEINTLLDNDSESLVPLVNKAARLAGLCGDLEHKILFECHIDGLQPDSLAGGRIQKWMEKDEPKWDIVKALSSDRLMKNGNIQTLSLQQLEYIRKEMRSAGAKTKSVIVATEFEVNSITGRICNRVSQFIRITEASILEEIQKENKILSKKSRYGTKVFIGHGRSLLWRDLKDFIFDRLHLSYDEFNREPTAGKSTKERLEEMLSDCCFAFLIMTAEDEHLDNSLHARENVIHEIGLFQGKLGFSKAIVLLEEGCSAFSNIHGLIQVRFPPGNIMAKSEELRRVLEREGVLGGEIAS